MTTTQRKEAVQVCVDTVRVLATIAELAASRTSAATTAYLFGQEEEAVARHNQLLAGLCLAKEDLARLENRLRDALK